MRHLTRTLNKLLLGCAGLALAGAVLANGEPSATIGRVTLQLGTATITQANGHKQAVTLNQLVHASDVIETGLTGFVQIRFVDDALFAVRPASTLEIIRYDYNPQRPQDSVIKFKLVEGTAHAISGEAAKQARQNFRLNTPIAAIGVRGTDFTVNADSRSERYIVNEGAIVVAELSSQCSADALGPCSANATELSGLSRQMLQLTKTTSGITSALLPTTTAQAQALMAEASAKVDTTTGSSNGKTAKAAETKELYAETVTSRAVNATLASNVKVVVTPPDSVTQTPTPTPDFTPAAMQAENVLTTNTQLVWGRWAEINLDSERITVSRSIAKENGLEITVSRPDLMNYGLYRDESAGKSLQSNLGVLSFDLSKAQAFFKSGGQSELMQVNGGQLSLDFGTTSYSTSLLLNHAKTGSVTFADSGNIYSDGIFHSSGDSDTQFMAGAVSLDGKEAGYFFQKILSGGSIEGLTLWNKKP